MTRPDPVGAWMPIATAPKKPGQKVDLWVVQRRIEGCRRGKPGDTHGHRVTDADWRNGWRPTGTLAPAYDGWIANNEPVERLIEYGAYVVTHWRSPPPPPEPQP